MSPGSHGESGDDFPSQILPHHDRSPPSHSNFLNFSLEFQGLLVPDSVAPGVSDICDIPSHDLNALFWLDLTTGDSILVPGRRPTFSFLTGVEPDLGLDGGKGVSGDNDVNTGGGGGGIFLVLTSVDPNVHLLVSGLGSGTLE